jgi:glutaredoxin
MRMGCGWSLQWSTVATGRSCCAVAVLHSTRRPPECAASLDPVNLLRLRMFTIASLLVAGMTTAILGGCKTKAAPAAIATAVVVRDDSAGQLLTWIDAKGDFHVETSAKEVPLEGRDIVRVIDTAAPASMSDTVTLADLRNKQADGQYATRIAARAEFEELATARRKQAGVAMVAPVPAATAPQANGAAADPAEATDSPRQRTKVIIYGASWCHACHDAARYLASHNIPYVEKDIEESPEAAREMQAKLRAAGQRGGSIPVLDVRGTVLIGFSPGEVERALGKST